VPGLAEDAVRSHGAARLTLLRAIR
jgi:hypothetical protein